MHVINYKVMQKKKDYYKNHISIYFVGGGGKEFAIRIEPRKTSQVTGKVLFLDLGVGKY